VQIDWWTLGLQAVNLLVLLWLLKRFLFRPVAAIIAARQAEAARVLDEAAAARDAAIADRDAAQCERRRQEEQRQAAIRTATAEAEAAAAARMTAARHEVDSLRSEAEARIAEERKRLRHADRSAAEQLALDIAARLLGRLPPAARVAGFIAGLTEALAALPPATRDSIGRDGAALRLRAPRPLEAAERADCAGQLSAARGRPVTLAVDVDPSLLAGLELDLPEAMVRNSLKADLARIAEELASHA
jgi:F-type H+-transporting ATPase subunit b